jgi:hypothetical protein
MTYENHWLPSFNFNVDEWFEIRYETLAICCSLEPGDCPASGCRWSSICDAPGARGAARGGGGIGPLTSAGMTRSLMFRYAPDSGAKLDIAALPRRARSRHGSPILAAV